MSYPKEKIVVLPASSSFDIGNTSTNAASIPIPFRCYVVEAVAVPLSAVSNSFTVGFNTLDSGTLSTDEGAGNVIVPDSAGAFIPYKDQGVEGKELSKHSVVMVDCIEAGDSGENAVAYLVVEYVPETDANEASDMIESA